MAHAAALALFESPPNLDACSLGGRPSLSPTLSVKALQTYRAAARYLVEDRVYGSVAKRISDETYDSGEAHLRLAADLIKAGRYERAYATLISAAYFTDANDEAYELAFALAHSQSWENVIATLESWRDVEPPC